MVRNKKAVQNDLKGYRPFLSPVREKSDDSHLTGASNQLIGNSPAEPPVASSSKGLPHGDLRASVDSIPSAVSHNQAQNGGTSSSTSLSRAPKKSPRKSPRGAKNAVFGVNTAASTKSGMNAAGANSAASSGAGGRAHLKGGNLMNNSLNKSLSNTLEKELNASAQAGPFVGSGLNIDRIRDVANVGYANPTLTSLGHVPGSSGNPFLSQHFKQDLKPNRTDGRGLYLADDDIAEKGDGDIAEEEHDESMQPRFLSQSLIDENRKRASSGQSSYLELPSHLPGNLGGISRAAVRRLARRGGVRRLASSCYIDIKCQMYYLLEELVFDINTIKDHQKKSTIKAKDVAYVLARRGSRIAGIGGNHERARTVHVKKFRPKIGSNIPSAGTNRVMNENSMNGMFPNPTSMPENRDPLAVSIDDGGFGKR